MRRAFRALAKMGWVLVARARLTLIGEHRLARALRGRDSPACDDIERLRTALLADNTLLIDGSLGEGGLYDQKQTVADVCRVSKPKHSARLLHSIAAEYQPKTMLELGTNIGISSAYLAVAGGHVTTLDVSPYRIRIAQNLRDKLSLKIDYVHGLFDDTLRPTLQRIPPVDLAFIDGNHQYEPTLRYFEAIAEKGAPNCIFIFDDIRWSEGMRRAWALLKHRREFRVIADLGDMGVAITR